MPIPEPPEFRAARLRLAADPYRPTYHFVAPAEWLNDPNGAVYWRGRHHLCYQYNPEFSQGSGACHWGHAVSENLVHWHDLPVAIAPEPGTYDEKGIWSGNAINDGERAIAIYHAHQSGNCIATSDDEYLVDWTKHPANPVIPPDPARIYDPCIWKEGDTYYSLSGRIVDIAPDNPGFPPTSGRGTAFMFRSTDLEHWDDLGPLYEGGVFTGPGEDCAVPDFFPLGDRHMLLFASHRRGGQYYLGTYADNHFTPETHGRMNFTFFPPGIIEGGEFMAPLSWRDGAGRRIVIGWCTEGRTVAVQREAGWAGIMTLPRIVSLAADGTLQIAPAPELETLRGERFSLAGVSVPADDCVTLDGVAGNRLEMAVTLECGGTDQVGIKVCCSPGDEEETVATYDRAAGTLTLDASRASLSKDMIGRELQVAPFDLGEGEPLELRVFVDRSIVEVFANGRQCVTKRIYPSRADSLGVRLFAHGGPATATVDTWQMNAIWPVAEEAA